jgi:hypothetical protein
LSNRENDLDWAEVKNSEEMLSALRDKDNNVADLGKVLFMRNRITQLEKELSHYKSLEHIWHTNRIGRLYYGIPRSLISLFRKIVSKK